MPCSCCLPKFLFRLNFFGRIRLVAFVQNKPTSQINLTKIHSFFINILCNLDADCFTSNQWLRKVVIRCSLSCTCQCLCKWNYRRSNSCWRCDNPRSCGECCRSGHLSLPVEHGSWDRNQESCTEWVVQSVENCTTTKVRSQLNSNYKRPIESILHCNGKKVSQLVVS